MVIDMLTIFMELLGKYDVQIATAVIGTAGFCLLYNIKKDKLIFGCIGGLISIVVYCICTELGFPVLIQNMIPAIAATLYAELIARVVKAPSTVFLIPSVIPLTPGGSLYYTMSAIVDGDVKEAEYMGQNTLMIALGIAVGIVLVSVVFYKLTHRNMQLKVSFTKGD